MDSVLRVAVLIIGVVLVVLLLPLTNYFYQFSQALDDGSGEREMLFGMIMLVMWLIASLSVLSFPLVSVALFVLAGLLGFALDGGFPILNLWVGPAISMVLAVLSFLGWGDQRRDRRQFTVERAHPGAECPPDAS